MLTVAIMTCPRGEAYLADTLRSCWNAGFESVAVSNDQSRSGAYRHFRRLAASLSSQSSCPVLLLQDDIRLSRNLSRLLEEKPWERRTDARETGCVSLYTAGPVAKWYSTPGWHDLPLKKPVARWVYGACGLLFTAEKLAEFVDANVAPEELNRVETHIAAWCLDRDYAFRVHAPESYVQHVGHVSAVTDHYFDLGVSPDRSASHFLVDLDGPVETVTDYDFPRPIQRFK